MNKVFKAGHEDFSAYHAACKWLRANGYSRGPTSDEGPAGVKKGNYYMRKWHLMSDEFKKSLDGRLYTSRSGDAIIEWNLALMIENARGK